MWRELWRESRWLGEGWGSRRKRRRGSQTRSQDCGWVAWSVWWVRKRSGSSWGVGKVWLLVFWWLGRRSA